MIRRIGPFKIESVLSKSGGFGVVYKACIDRDKEKDHHERIGRCVALKVARAQGPHAATIEQTLKDEIAVLNDLRHPGIVRVFPVGARRRYLGRATEFDNHNPPFYFIMELLDNAKIEKLAADNRFSMSWRVELLYQIAAVLDYLHLREFAHRDLKPDNILFRNPPSPDQTPQPVLIDFGLANKGNNNHQVVNAMTTLYASPERIYARHSGISTEINIDHKAVDVWALGVIAYELLNRRYPFSETTSKTALEDKIVNHSPEPMNPDIPKGLQQLVMQMLSKNPGQRPNIGYVIQALETDTELISPRI